MAQQQLEAFLAGIEKRAFRMARLAVGNDADALDIVQDAMMKLVERYASRAESEWPPLFYRILQNRIMDFHRDSKRRWMFWKSVDEDAVESQDSAVETGENPADLVTAERTTKVLMAEIAALPRQQQQCFMLRSWEGLSVEETARSMQLSTGSVKTHYFRALARLRQVLEKDDDH